jgi:WD40 repeat protein
MRLGKKIILLLFLVLSLSFCVHNQNKSNADLDSSPPDLTDKKQDSEKEYTALGLNSFQGTKAFPLVMAESENTKFTDFPKEHTLIWGPGIGERSIRIYDTASGIERYVGYNDPNATLHNVFVLDNEKKLIVLDYSFPGGGLFRIYDFVNDKIIDEISKKGFIYYFGQNKLLYCAIQDRQEQKYKWIIANPLSKEKWENELTKVLTEKQIFFYPQANMRQYHGRTVNMNLKKRILIGEIKNKENEEGEFVVVYWEGEGEKARVMPITEQLAGEFQVIDEIEICREGDWMIWQQHLDYESERIAIYLHHLSAEYPEGISEPIFCGIFSDDSDGTFCLHPELGPCYCFYDYTIKNKIFVYPLKELEKKIAEGSIFIPKDIDLTELMQISDENPLSLAKYANKVCFLSRGKSKLNVLEISDYLRMRAAGFAFNLNRAVTAFQLAPNGEYLAVAFADKEFAFFTIKNKGLIKEKELNESVQALEISDNSEFIFTGEENIIKQWDRGGNFLRIFAKHSLPIGDICLSKDMGLIAAADKGNNLVIWNQKGEKLGTVKLSNPSLNLKFSDNAEMLICNRSASDPRYLKIGNKKIRLVGSPEENNWFFPLSSAEKDKFVSYSKADNNYYIKDLDGKIIINLIYYPCIVTENNWEKTIDPWLKAERLETVIDTKYPAEITSLVTTPDGRIITGHGDGTIIFRNNKGITEKIFKAHNTSVSMLALSTGGDYLASGGWDKKVVIFKSSGEYLKTLAVFTRDIRGLSFNKADELVILWGDRIEKRNIQGQTTFSYKSEAWVEGINAEGTKALIEQDKQFYLLDLLSLKKTNLVGIENYEEIAGVAAIAEVRGAAISANDNNDVLLIKSNGKIERFNPQGKKIDEERTNIRLHPMEYNVKGAVYSPTEKMTAVFSYDFRQFGRLLRIFYAVKIESADGTNILNCRHYSLPAEKRITRISMCFSYPENKLLTAYGTMIYIWDLSDSIITSQNTIVDIPIPPEKIQEIPGQGKPILEYKPSGGFKALNFSSQYIVTAESEYQQDTIKIADLCTAKEVSKWFISIENFVMTKDSRYIFCSNYDGIVKKYEIKSGVQIWKSVVFSQMILHLAVSEDGKYLAVCKGYWRNEMEIAILDCDTGKILWRITDPEVKDYTIHLDNLKFSQDSRFIAVNGIKNGNAVCIWELSGKKVKELSPEENILDFEFSHDNRYFITANSQGNKSLSTLTVWDRSTMQKVWSYPDISGYIKCLAISADDKYIFTGDSEDTIHVFSLESGSLLNSVRYCKSEILYIFITDNDEHLAAYDENGNIFVWKMADFFIE